MKQYSATEWPPEGERLIHGGGTVGLWASLVARQGFLRKRTTTLLACLLLHGFAIGQSPVFYGAFAGKAKAEVHGAVATLSNRMMEAQWSVADGRLTGSKFMARGTAAEMALPRDPFLLILKDGALVRASEMALTDSPRVQVLHPDAHAS